MSVYVFNEYGSPGVYNIKIFPGNAFEDKYELAYHMLCYYDFKFTKSLDDFLERYKDKFIMEFPDDENSESFLSILETQGFLEHKKVKWYDNSYLDQLSGTSPISSREILNAGIKHKIFNYQNIWKYLTNSKKDAVRYSIEKVEMEI